MTAFEKFEQELKNDLHAADCPFLIRWLNDRFRRIKRKEHWKQDYLPLILAFRNKVSLKAFAEAYNLNYGTVRNWARKKEILLKKREFIESFLEDYFGEIYVAYQLIGEKGPSHLELIGEIEFYSPTVREEVKKKTLEQTVKLGQMIIEAFNADDLKKAMLLLGSQHCLRIVEEACALKLTIDSPNIDEATLREREKDQMKSTDMLFETIKKGISSHSKDMKPKTLELVLGLFDLVEGVLKGNIRSYTNLQVQYISKGKHTKKT